MFAPVPLMIGTALSRNLRILAFRGNPTEYAQADGRGNRSPVQTDWKPWSGLGPDNRSPVPETLVN